MPPLSHGPGDSISVCLTRKTYTLVCIIEVQVLSETESTNFIGYEVSDSKSDAQLHFGRQPFFPLYSFIARGVSTVALFIIPTSLHFP